MTALSRNIQGNPSKSPGSAATTVAWAVRHLRQTRGISARQLSLDSGLSPSYVSKIESGEIEPSFKGFAKLAATLEMTTLEVAFCLSCETDGQFAKGTLDGKTREITGTPVPD